MQRLEAHSQNYEKRICLSMCLSVRPRGTSRLPQDGFFEILCLRIFRKSVNKIRVLLQFDKDDGYFTWRPTYTFTIDNIALNYSKCFKRAESDNTFCMNFFPDPAFCEIMWTNVEPDDNIIRRMRFACWVTKATSTLVILIIIAFPR